MKNNEERTEMLDLKVFLASLGFFFRNKYRRLYHFWTGVPIP